ncbi:MAG: hypothetical protein WKG07_46150 [Hymenobacter sp.]
MVRGVIALEQAVEAFAGGRNRKVDLLDRNLAATRALIPRRQHPPVVLLRRHHLITRLEIDAILRDLQRLARSCA